MAVAKGPLEGGREGGREGERERGREGGREGGREEEREGGRERGRERGREGSDYRGNKPLQHSIILVSVKHTLCARAFVFIISLSLSSQCKHTVLYVCTRMLQQYFSPSSPDGLGAGGTDSLSLGELGSH